VAGAAAHPTDVLALVDDLWSGKRTPKELANSILHNTTSKKGDPTCKEVASRLYHGAIEPVSDARNRLSVLMAMFMAMSFKRGSQLHECQWAYLALVFTDSVAKNIWPPHTLAHAGAILADTSFWQANQGLIDKAFGCAKAHLQSLVVPEGRLVTSGLQSLECIALEFSAHALVSSINPKSLRTFVLSARPPKAKDVDMSTSQQLAIYLLEVHAWSEAQAHGEKN